MEVVGFGRDVVGYQLVAALGGRLAVNDVPHLGEAVGCSVVGKLDQAGVVEVVLPMLVLGACMVVAKPVVDLVWWRLVVGSLIVVVGDWIGSRSISRGKL